VREGEERRGRERGEENSEMRGLVGKGGRGEGNERPRERYNVG
jgi:hypothetical protein